VIVTVPYSVLCQPRPRACHAKVYLLNSYLLFTLWEECARLLYNYRRMKADPATMDPGESPAPPPMTSPMMSYVAIGKSTSPSAAAAGGDAESCYAAAARPTCYYACSLDVPGLSPACCPYSCGGRPPPPPPPPAPSSFAPYATTTMTAHSCRQNSDDGEPM